jgi:multidrug resistance efflux pump
VFTWVRLAQRIPVRLRLTTLPQGMPLTAGMTCTVSVGQTSSLRDDLTFATKIWMRNLSL